MKLIQLYKSLLATANLITTDDGCISRKYGDITKPALIKGKRLVMPAKEHLANPNKDEIMVFHPLSENILKGESAVLEDFRISLNVTLNFKIGLLGYSLLTIATSTGDHAKLNPDQLEFLSAVKNADEKTLEVFQKLMKAMATNQQQNTFVSIYLKRGGSVGNKRHSRAGIVSFPFYTELTNGTGDVYGIKLRVKDRETLINLMEYMFPMISEAESHNRGSDSTIAPYLDALMKAVMAIASPINDQVTLFSNMLDEPDEIMVENDWVETFENLEVMLPEIRMVPMQAGNEGSSGVVAATPVIAPNPLPTPAIPVWQQPNGGYPYGQPPVYAAVGYQPPAPPAPIKTAAGLDFDSILRSNPALAQSVGGPGGFNPTGNNNYGRPTESVPRWAGGGMNMGNNSGPYGNTNNFNGGYTPSNQYGGNGYNSGRPSI